MNLDNLPEAPLERLAMYRNERAHEEEKRRVEELLEKRRRGFDLAAHEEAIIAYSPFGTGQHCASTGFFLGSAYAER